MSVLQTDAFPFRHLNTRPEIRVLSAAATDGQARPSVGRTVGSDAAEFGWSARPTLCAAFTSYPTPNRNGIPNMDAIPDPVGLLTALAALVPGAAKYLPGAIAYLGLAAGVCAIVVAAVKPPSSTAPAWWIATYRALNWIALNLGNARNAAVPGMKAEVRDAALVSAKVMAAAPDLATVAVPVAIQGAIATAPDAGVPVAAVGDPPAAIRTLSDSLPPRVATELTGRTGGANTKWDDAASDATR